MKRLIPFLLLLLSCVVGIPNARADKNDDRVSRIVQRFRDYEKTTFKYPDGRSIAHADMLRILNVGDGGTTLIDQGIDFANLLEMRDRYSDRQYADASSQLNADVIWAAVGAPGVSASQWNDPSWGKLIQWGIDKAKSKIIRGGVETADSYYPGVEQAYKTYGGFANYVNRYKAIEKVINAATKQGGNIALNALVRDYVTDGMVINPENDAADLDDFFLGVRIESLQRYVNSNFPQDGRIDVHEFCKSAWYFNRRFFDSRSESYRIFQDDIERYKLVVNAQIKIYFGYRLSIADASVVEGSSKLGSRNLSFPVTLSAALPYDVSVRYVTNSISATATADYVSTVVGIPGKLTIKAGQKSGTISIKVWSDTTEEKDEQFRVTLSSPDGALLDKESRAVGTIIDDDYAGKISIDDYSLTEGNSGQKSARLTISLLPASLHKMEISYRTQDGTAKAGSDYTATTGKIVFNANRLTQTVNVPVSGDTEVESDETFKTIISASGYKIYKATSTITVVNDDKPAPTPTPVPTATPTPTETPTPAPSSSGKIAFGHSVDTSYDIYVMNEDGSNRTRLTFTGNNIFARFNKEGTLIVFESFRDGNSEIYLMNADGTGLKRLTSDASDDECPDFSSDDTRILFTSDRTGSKEVWTMDLQGGGLSRVTSEYGGVAQPRAVPGGSSVVYEKDGYIYSINLDGSNLRSVCSGYYPSVSRDGKELLFAYSSIYSLLLTSGQTKLAVNFGDTQSFFGFTDPVYKGDQKGIFYVQTPGQPYESAQIFYHDLNSQNSLFLATGYQPSWAPGSVPAPSTAKTTASQTPSKAPFKPSAPSS